MRKAQFSRGSTCSGAGSSRQSGERLLVGRLRQGHSKDLEATAQAWLVLAKRVAEAEALEKQAAALEIAKVAPDIARTAASSDCGSLKQVADDIRGFHLSHPASYAERKTAPAQGRAEASVGDAIICAGVRPPGCPVQAGRSNLVPRSSENISLRYIAFQSSAKIRCASDLITFTSDCPSVRRRAAHTKKSPER